MCGDCNSYHITSYNPEPISFEYRLYGDSIKLNKSLFNIEVLDPIDLRGNFSGSTIFYNISNHIIIKVTSNFTEPYYDFFSEGLNELVLSRKLEYYINIFPKSFYLYTYRNSYLYPYYNYEFGYMINPILIFNTTIQINYKEYYTDSPSNWHIYYAGNSSILVIDKDVGTDFGISFSDTNCHVDFYYGKYFSHISTNESYNQILNVTIINW
jgi:hypothetical protein